jgi:DNA-binding NarL/FixJ family response regulator
MQLSIEADGIMDFHSYQHTGDADCEPPIHCSPTDRPERDIGPAFAYIAVPIENVVEALTALRAILPDDSLLYINGLGEWHPDSDRATRRPNPTSRQADILNLLREDLSNKEIARKLNLSHLTVRNQISHLLKIFNVSSRQEMVKVFENAAPC